MLLEEIGKSMSGNKNVDKYSRRGVSLHNAVHNICSPILNGKPCYSVFTDWDKIVGKRLAMICSPEKINEKTKTLYISAEPGAFLEIQYSEISLLEKINLYIGCNFFTKIKVSQKRCHIKKNQDSNTFFTKIEFNIGDETLELQLSRLFSSMETK